MVGTDLRMRSVWPAPKDGWAYGRTDRREPASSDRVYQNEKFLKMTPTYIKSILPTYTPTYTS